MGDVNTGWIHATTDVNEAIVGFISCIQAGNNAWIELRSNGDQTFPIMKPNPELDDPFNWRMSYGAPRDEKILKEHKYLNETEKDLTYNWTAGFGDPEAIRHYRETGEIVEGLLSGIGTQFPIRIKDAEEYREKITGDNYKYRFFMTYWTPKDGIRPYVVDDNVDKVFVVCYTEEPVDKKAALHRAAYFLNTYADTLE